jgi:hypothetical protein
MQIGRLINLEQEFQTSNGRFIIINKPGIPGLFMFTFFSKTTLFIVYLMSITFIKNQFTFKFRSLNYYNFYIFKL